MRFHPFGRRLLQAVVGLAVSTSVLTSCDHKELCYEHPHIEYAHVRLFTDWSLFTQEQPTGMSVMLYSADDGKQYTALTNTLTHADFDLPVGGYSGIVFNQSPSEFGSVHFVGLEHFETAAVYANERTSRWYQSRADEYLITEPEWIASDSRADIMVTERMLSATAAQLMASQRQHQAPPDGNHIGTFVPECVVKTVSVTIRVSGIQNLRAVRGSIDGLACGYGFASKKPVAATGTQLIEEWNVTADPADPSKGIATATFRSFGLPDGHGGIAEQNQLNVSFLLVDNKTQLDYSFNIGDKFRTDASADISLSVEQDIADPLPDVKPEGGSSSGFDVSVDDWGENIDIDINT